MADRIQITLDEQRKEVKENMNPTYSSEEKLLRNFRKLPENRKSEVLDFVEFLSGRNAAPATEGDAYAENLQAIRIKIRERGGLIFDKSKDQVIEKMRETRESLWKEEYADRFGQQ